MSEQPALFPDPGTVEPPARCPDCGLPVRRVSFISAVCVSCPYAWRRDGQLAANEPWPGEPF